MNRTTDIAWLAGLIDGEGHIAFQKSATKTRKNPGYSGKLWIGMYSRSAIEKAARIMGVKVRAYRNYEKTTWVVDARGVVAKDILLEVLPYMTTKAGEARLLIEAIEACSGFLIGNGRSLSQEQLALREGYHIALHEAKRVAV